MIDPGGAGDRRLIPLGRDGRPGTNAPDVFAQGMAGVAAVSHDPSRRLRQTAEQLACHRQFMRLPWRQAESDGTAAAISDYAGFGAIAAT
jgi:hypothetical protein